MTDAVSFRSSREANRVSPEGDSLPIRVRHLGSSGSAEAGGRAMVAWKGSGDSVWGGGRRRASSGAGSGGAGYNSPAVHQGRADSGSPRRPSKASGSCNTTRAVGREGVIGADPTAWLKANREGMSRGGNSIRLRRVNMVQRTVGTCRGTELQDMSAHRRIGLTAEGSRLVRNRRPCPVYLDRNRSGRRPDRADRRRDQSSEILDVRCWGSGQHGSARSRRRRPESHGVTCRPTRAKVRRDSP